MNGKGLVPAIAIILVSNAWLLTGAGFNRRGGPIQSIRLTERELALETEESDNSGVILRLVWRIPPRENIPTRPFGGVAFDSEKLKELGFDCSLSDENSPHFRLPPPREVFLALEYEGSAWQSWH